MLGNTAKINREDMLGKTNLLPFLIRSILIGFLFNLAWENAQAPLYRDYGSFWQHFPMCLAASAMDAVIVVALYLIVARLRHSIDWIANTDWISVLLLVGLGGITVAIIEKSMLFIGIWGYASSMPLLFNTGIGLTPLLQLMILPLPILLISHYSLKMKRK
jgi:hypothetical protein